MSRELDAAAVAHRELNALLLDRLQPDARQYECDLCGERKVYGIEELLMMGLVKLSDDTPAEPAEPAVAA